MAEEVLRLGVDPRGGVRGMQQFSAATTKAVGTAWSMNAVLGTMAASFGALAAGRAIGAGIKGMMDFDQAMTQSLAIQGEMAQSMRGEMAAAARQVGQELNFAATEGAEAFFFLASAGLDAEQQLAALPAVAEFARAGMFDFATATDLATDAQSALGLATEDAQKNLQSMTRVTDVLVKANTLANATVEQFASALTTEAGAALKSFNIDVEEGVAVLAAFADQGVKGQTAGSGLSRILRLMSSAAVNNKEEMAALGLEIFDSQGNMRNMADVVESLENALGGMSDAQRVAALESIGFQARVQGVLLPLLGTSDAIREYEAGLRDAGGTTRDVAEGQMQSLENRIGAIRRQFENWRDEMAARTIPAIEWAIENVDTLTDAVVGLSIAIGTLMAFKVGAWAVAAAVAFGGWITAVGSLALGVKSLTAALALLQAAIPVLGWVSLGIGAITAGVIAWRRANREAQDSQDALRDSTRSLTERLDEQTDAFKRLTDAQLQSQIAQREARAEQIRSQMQELEGQLAVGAPAGTTENLDRHREALAAEEEAIKRINGLLLERHAIEGVTTQTVRERTQAQQDGVNGLREHIALLADALDLDVQTHAALETALDLRDGIRSEIDGGVESMERLVELMQDEAKVQEAITRHMERRIGLEKESLRIAEGITNRWGRVVALQGGPAMNAMVLIRDEAGRVVSQIERMASATDQVVVSTGALEGQYSRINSQAEDAANQSIDWAQAFDDHWQTAIHSVGASLGGVASQIANVAGAFASGGAMAGLAAGAGMFLGEIFGQGVSRFEEAADEWEAALDDFVDMFADPSRWNRMRDQVQGAFDEHLTKAILSGFVDTAPQVQAWADTIQRVFTEIQDAEGIDAAIEAVTGIMQQLGASTEQIDALTEAYRDNIAAIEAQRQAAVGSMTEELQIRQLVAQGMDDAADAMRLEIERRKEMAEARELEDEALVELLRHTWEIEDAFREAADATRALREARDEELSLTEREAALRGDDRGALHARLQRQAEAELNALQDRLDAGRISEAHFQRIADLISGEVNQALADYEDQQRASMQALQDDIAVRELLVAGMDDEAAALRLEIRQRQELAEAMALAGDASDDLIERLRALHDAEREGLGAGPSATAEVRRAATQGRSDIASVTGITEASALRLQDIGLSQLQRLTAIEFNTSVLRGGSFQPSGVAGRPTQGGDTYNFSVSIHTTGDVTPAGARALGTEVVDQMDRRFGGRIRRQNRLAGEMGVTR